MGIYIICGEPGVGKTRLLTYIARCRAFDRERNKAMEQEIKQMQENGFKVTMPKHNVCSNYELKLHKFCYSERRENRINPFRLGFQRMTKIKLHFIAPYSTIFITEGQKYLNSRMSMYYPDFQSRWYEAHRHLDLDIFIDVQRAMLIDTNVRSLATIIEIQSCEDIFNKLGQRAGTIWKVKVFATSEQYENYLSGGRKDISAYSEKTITADCDVCSMYDHKSCKPKFIDGHYDDDFTQNYGEDCGSTPEELIAYLEKYDDEMPTGFYERRKVA